MCASQVEKTFSFDNSDILFEISEVCLEITHAFLMCNNGSVDLLSHFTKVKCDSWT